MITNKNIEKKMIDHNVKSNESVIVTALAAISGSFLFLVLILSIIGSVTLKIHDNHKKKLIKDFYKKNKDTIDKLSVQFKNLKIYEYVKSIDKEIIKVIESMDLKVKDSYMRAQDFNKINSQEEFYNDLIDQIAKNKTMKPSNDFCVDVVPKNPKPEMFQETYENDPDYGTYYYEPSYLKKEIEILEKKVKTIKLKNYIQKIDFRFDVQDGGLVNNDSFAESYKDLYPFSIGFKIIIDFNKIMKEMNVKFNSTESLNNNIYFASIF